MTPVAAARALRPYIDPTVNGATIMHDWAADQAEWEAAYAAWLARTYGAKS